MVADLLAREGLRLKDDKLFEEWTVPPILVLKGLKAENSFVRIKQPYRNLISRMTRTNR